jgi:hypothetical protein
MCWIYGGQSGTEAVFLRALRFTCQSFIPSLAPQLSSIIQVWDNRPINGRINSGLGSTPEKKNCMANAFLYLDLSYAHD